MTDHSILERRLHDASDPSGWADVSPDAWQQNERRVAADRSRRAGQRLRVVAAAAAVAVVVGGGVLVMSQLRGSSLPPSSGGSKDGSSKTQDPFEPDNAVGKTVVLERFRANGAAVVHWAFLTRAGGKGLSLCDLYRGPDTVSSSAGSGSCTASSPDHATPKTNAFAFVTSREGSDLKGVTGAVEPRVASLKAWVGDSAVERPVALHALGIKGLQAFGITTVGKQAPVVRIVAYDDKGTLLQVLDAPSYFGAEWLPDDDTCAQTVQVQPSTGPDPSSGPSEIVEVATSSVHLSGTAGPSDLCVAAPKGGAASAPTRQGQSTVVVTGPEVATVRVKVGAQAWQVRTPNHYTGTPWGVVMVGSTKQTISFVARGADGQKLSYRQYYRIPTD